MCFWGYDFNENGKSVNGYKEKYIVYINANI